MHIREKQFFVLLSPALHLPQMETPWEWGWGALGAAGGWIQTGKRQEWLGVIQAGGELALCLSRSGQRCGRGQI